MALILDKPPAIILPAKPAILRRAIFQPGFLGRASVATRDIAHNADAGTPSSDNFTVTSVALGSAIGTSLVVVLAHVWSNGTQPTITSISIDGSNGTLHQAQLATNGISYDASIGIASRATSNTSGTIIVRCNNGSSNGYIHVFRLNRLTSAAPFDSDSTSNTTPANASVNLDIPAGGVIIAGGSTVNPLNASVGSITGVTQDGAAVEAGVILYKWVYGSDQSQSAQTGRTITSVLQASGIANAMVAASWQ